MMPVYETHLMDEYFADVYIYKQDLTCVAFMASHLICGQTNYYLSTLEAFVNQFIDDL